ncbi:MAG TPA: hypothetical protein VFA69_00325 [Candidatus Nitrosotalea sp.]|nr:hypothetical protein [Candidatus Nitrosotalea sp.]
MRSLKKVNAPTLADIQVHYNFIRTHMECKTPSEMAGIKIKGNNKWITAIQNASKR